MGTSSIVPTIDEILETGRRAKAAIEALSEQFVRARAYIERDAPASEMVHELLPQAAETRRATQEAFQRFLREVMRFRSMVVRSLVDDEGWTLTAVASRLGTSRQFVSRLYRQDGVQEVSLGAED